MGTINDYMEYSSLPAMAKVHSLRNIDLLALLSVDQHYVKLFQISSHFLKLLYYGNAVELIAHGENLGI